jgi:hypothetical protein
MAESLCDQAMEAAPDIALGLLPSDEAARLSAHSQHCDSCRAEIESYDAVARGLADLVPGTEPPLGFDRRVLAKLAIGPSDDLRAGPRHRRRYAVATLAAAAVAAIAALGGWSASHSTGPEHYPKAISAVFHQGGRQIGELSLYRSKGGWWLSVDVHGAGGSGMVTCEMTGTDGSIHRLGSFDLVKGNGSWEVPDPGGPAGISGAILVQQGGLVLASASFR